VRKYVSVISAAESPTLLYILVIKLRLFKKIRILIPWKAQKDRVKDNRNGDPRCPYFFA
jgi:hypothetical protein